MDITRKSTKNILLLIPVPVHLSLTKSTHNLAITGWRKKSIGQVSMDRAHIDVVANSMIEANNFKMINSREKHNKSMTTFCPSKQSIQHLTWKYQKNMSAARYATSNLKRTCKVKGQLGYTYNIYQPMFKKYTSFSLQTNYNWAFSYLQEKNDFK
jgi:hypothetical protein